MQFRDEIADMVLDANVFSDDELRFHLASSSDQEVFAHFKATFAQLRKVQKQGYSAECVRGVKYALYETLLEMRVRGFEADHSGTIYRPTVIVPVPGHRAVACRRQTEKLKRVSRESLRHMCDTTRKIALRAASQESKGGLAFA
jgi:hypothetical protein